MPKMTQLDSTHQNGGMTRTVKPLHCDSPIAWNIPFTLGRINDPEDHLYLGKKFSVIAKVTETARKWRQSLVRKRNTDDGNNTPAWGVSLEDYEEDLEHLGASVCESEHAPESCNKISRLHQTADQVVCENQSENQEQEKCSNNVMNTTESKSHSDDRANRQREEDPTTTKTLVAERLPCPEMATETACTETSFVDEEHLSNEKTTSQNVIHEIEEEDSGSFEKLTETESIKSDNTEEEQEKKHPSPRRTIKEAMSEKLAPAYAIVSEATDKITSKIQSLSPFQVTGEDKLDKGISFTEYIRRKLEPGKNERALSEIISELIRPRRTHSEKGVIEKVKEALTLLLQTEEPSSPSSTKGLDSSSQIPISTNAYEGVEEHQRRDMQAH